MYDLAIERQPMQVVDVSLTAGETRIWSTKEFRVRKLLLLILGLGVTSVGWSDCKQVDSTTPGHYVAIYTLTDLIQIEPTEVHYCEYEEYSQWIARWDVYESYRGWRKFATAYCADRETEYRCIATRHVVAADSYDVIDLPYDIAISRVMELRESAAESRPGEKITKVNYTVVANGGAWSEEDYGYRVTLLKPPQFTVGAAVIYRRKCEEACRWIGRSTARVYPGSSQKRLRELRKKHADPLIELMTTF